MMNIFYLLWSVFCALAIVYGYSRGTNAAIKRIEKRIKEVDEELMGYIRQLRKEFEKLNLKK